MSPLSLDIRTVIALLFVGNLIAAGILAAYKIEQAVARPYRQFIAGKILQALAWALLVQRGEIPDILSVHLGNAVLLVAFALEVSAVSISDQTQRRLETVYAILAGCGTVAFWLLAETPSQRVALASIATIALFGTASVVMLRTTSASRLRRVIGTAYAGFCLVLAFRAGFAVLTPGGIGLMTSNLVQDLSFLVLFLMVLAGGIGFLLLIKERGDQRLVESESTLRTIIETEPECVKVLGPDGTLLQMNRAGLDMIEADSEDQVLGRRVARIVAPASRKAFEDLCRRVNQGNSGILEFEIIGLKGTHRVLETHAVPMRDGTGAISGLLGITRDITARKNAEQELARLAQTDPLTGLANRRHFMALAEQELAHALRYGGPLSVFMMDIDHFKNINDTYGHQTGDLVLQKLGALFKDALRDVDCIGRVGGEEFAVVLPQTDGQRALDVAERLRASVANTEVALPHGLPLRLTLSIGAATLAGGGANVDSVLGQADNALYEAKRSGRNRVCVFGL